MTCLKTRTTTWLTKFSTRSRDKVWLNLITTTSSSSQHGWFRFRDSNQMMSMSRNRKQPMRRLRHLEIRHPRIHLTKKDLEASRFRLKRCPLEWISVKSEPVCRYKTSNSSIVRCTGRLELCKTRIQGSTTASSTLHSRCSFSCCT
jgi:hypothetical protein